MLRIFFSIDFTFTNYVIPKIGLFKYIFHFISLNSGPVAALKTNMTLATLLGILYLNGHCG